MFFRCSQFVASLGALVCFSVSVWAAPARITVLGPDAKPLAGVKVSVSERLDYFKTLPTRELVTGADGAVTLEINEGESPRHSYTARVLAPGFAVAGGNIAAGPTKFQLQSAQKWGGVVLDNKQRPVAGVRLRFDSWFKAGFDFDGAIALDPILAPVAITDEAGRYSFDTLPLRGRASLTIADPRYLGATYDLDLAQEAPPLFVKMAGMVTGRIVRPDGKPPGELQIAFLDSNHFENRLTAPDGTFSIGGLGPGTTSLRSFEVFNGLVLKELPFGPLKPGETRALPDWIASPALEVSGQVVDSVSKKPLAGVSVALLAESSQRAKTDAQGRFKTLVSRDAYLVRLESEAHLDKDVQITSIPPGAAKHDLGVIAMAAGARVAGTVRDEKGVAPRPFYLNLENKELNFSKQIGATEGALNPVALAPGTYQLEAVGLEIVSPKTLVVPATGKVAPLQIIVKTAAATFPKIPTVTGRVVDGAGKPVAGAVVKFKGQSNMGYDGLRAVSGADGRFSGVPWTEEKPELTGIERPGFILSAGGEVSKVEANWQIGDIVLQPGGQIFSGRVLQGGKPVAGARVALAGNNWRDPAQTDATGTFRFEDLPGGEVEFLAASATGFSSLKTRGDAKYLTLNLEPIPATDAVALGNELLKAQPTRGDWRLGWEVFGAEAMETIALRADKALDEADQPVVGKGGYRLFQFFADLARHDKARLLERGPQLLPIFRVGQARIQSEAILARVQAASGDQEAQKAAAAWLEREIAEKRGQGVEKMAQMLAMADVAARLKRPEAPLLLDLALSFAVQLPEKVREDNADVWGARTALIGPAALDALLQDLSAVQSFNALGGAIRALARGGDFDGARLALAKMTELQASPEIKAADQAEAKPNGQKFESRMEILLARAELAENLAATDATGALAIAGQTETDRDIDARWGALLEVAAAAGRNGKKDVAETALNAVKTAPNNVDYGARAAAIAMGFNPAMGATFFQDSLALAAPTEENRDYQSSIATWAFEQAPFDPALSRAVLEREWSWRLPAYQAAEAAKKTPKDYNPNENIIGDLAWAMSALDPARALEWIQILPEKSYYRGMQQARIALTLLATPAQRVNFNRYVKFENADF